MADTGIMGSSGEFRTNPSSGKHSGGHGGGAFSKLGQMFSDKAKENRDASERQLQRDHEVHLTTLEAAGQAVNTQYAGKNAIKLEKTKGKQARKNMAATSFFRQGDIEHAKKSNVSSFGGNYQTGEHNVSFRTPPKPSAPTAPPTGAAPQKPATTRSAQAPAPVKPVPAPKPAAEKAPVAKPATTRKPAASKAPAAKAAPATARRATPKK